MELFIINEDGSLAEECEMQLIAKDGLYMLNIPRKVQHVVLPAAGRCIFPVMIEACTLFVPRVMIV